MHTNKEAQIFDNIIKPLADAMKKLKINQNSVMKEYADVLFSKDTPAATKLHAIEVWFKLLGLSAPEKLEVTEIHKIKVNKKNIKKNKKG